MQNFRKATSADHMIVVALLRGGDPDRVLMKSETHPEVSPICLLKVVKGPFEVTDNGISCQALNGATFRLIIEPGRWSNVYIQSTDGEWQAPENGTLSLLIPD